MTVYCFRTLFCISLFILCSLQLGLNSVFLWILTRATATFCNQLKKNISVSFRIWRVKHNFLRRPPAQCLYPYFPLQENALKLFSCHALFPSEGSGCHCLGQAEQPPGAVAAPMGQERRNGTELCVTLCFIASSNAICMLNYQSLL